VGSKLYSVVSEIVRDTLQDVGRGCCRTVANKGLR
jgi:hypothetical protein